MILTLAWKALVAHPVRTAVLGVGFGLGVGVMATLLGVGEVVLEQARAPVLVGGGQLVMNGVSGTVTSARYAVAMLRRMTVPGTSQSASSSPSTSSVVASPRKRADLFLVRNGTVVPVHARGGIPSLERALGDPETSSVAAWTDTAADAAWSSPADGDLLRAMDRFHAIPDVPARAASWVEWLYFRGQLDRDADPRAPAGTTGGITQFYLAFLVGPKRDDGRRVATVRLQLDRSGEVTSYADVEAVDDAAILASAPDLTIGRSRLRLEGLRYHVTLDLPDATAPGRSRISGEIVIDAIAGRSLPPIVIRGAGGWLSGYTVPVMSGRLSGSLTIGDARVAMAGSAYHDHNWGFWDGVSWRWGQVQHGGLSYIYGRVLPPPDAADPERSPGVLIALGPDGPVGYSTRVSIEETDDPATRLPRRIVVQGRGASLDLTLDLAVESAIVNRGRTLGSGADFLQLHARYHVTGRAGGQTIDFTAEGAAETFRGR